jgi:hypothetical protein
MVSNSHKKIQVLSLTSFSGIASGNKSKKPGPQMPVQNLVSPLQYSAMLKLYSTTADDTANYGEPEKNELAIRKVGGNGNGGGGGGPNSVHGPANKKSSFEGKEYSRLSTNDKDGSNGVEPETLFSSSAEDSDIAESSKAKSDAGAKSEISTPRENVAA